MLPPNLKHYRMKYSMPTQTVRSHIVTYFITVHSSVITHNLILNTDQTLNVRLYFYWLGSGLRLEEEVSFIAVGPTINTFCSRRPSTATTFLGWFTAAK